MDLIFQLPFCPPFIPIKLTRMEKFNIVLERIWGNKRSEIEKTRPVIPLLESMTRRTDTCTQKVL